MLPVSTVPTVEVSAQLPGSQEEAPQQIQVSQAAEAGPGTDGHGWGDGSGYVYGETSYAAEPSYVSWETQSGYGDVVAPSYEAAPPPHEALLHAWHGEGGAHNAMPQPDTGAYAVDYSYQGVWATLCELGIWENLPGSCV